MFEDNAGSVIGKRVGNYVVERTLAQGGMGSVFVARHPTLGREAAVKFLGPDIEVPPELTKRFLDEARITANLNHPNIVDIFDFGELDGRLYYVMELLDGRDLAALMRSKRRFTSDEAVDFLEQICSGLAAAHAVGVVHRDLKPGNIFVVRGDPPRLKLMDFGVAKIMSTKGDQTRYGQIIGTPRYMSPEQALGQIDRISPQSDIYSLGIIAYEMLAGVSPFEHDSPVMLLVMHVRDPVRPIEELVPGIPPLLSELIEACLAKEPKDRPVSAQDILDRFAGMRRQSGPQRKDESEVPIPLVAKEQFVDANTVLDAPVVPTPSPVVPTPSPVVETPRALKVASQHPPEDSATNAKDPPVLADPLACAEALDAEVSHVPEAVHLTEGDRSTLNRLLSRMQRRGDFPAFVQNVGEVNKRADFESSFSAEKLGDSILKDYALTAKLLRIVNSAYANRFGGKIYSVQHAIVILGFDRVRSLALSISLFKNKGNKEHSERISESAINSLVSGEIARQLYSDADLDHAEQAMVCSMFRNLGRHLVLVYLPELYDKIVAVMQQEGASLNHASERVLGLSLHKLGVGIAERWRLPPKMISAMSVIPERTGKLRREEDKLAALAELSNQLCEIVASDLPTEERSDTLKALLSRHRNLIHIEPDDLTALLQTTQQSFEKRYSSLLGTATKTSRFARTVATLSGQGTLANAAASAEMLAPVDHAAALPQQLLPMEPTREVPPHSAAGAFDLRKDRAKPQIAPLQLGKAVEPIEPVSAPTEGSGTEKLDVAVAQALAEFGRSGSSEQLLSTLLNAVAQYLEVPRILALRATLSRRELTIVGGLGDDVDGLTKELRPPLTPARAATDPFSLSYHSNRDFFFEDVFAPKVVASLPQRYYEAVGSTSLMILGCSGKGTQPLVLMADLDPPRRLPVLERVAQLTHARSALAKIAPTVTH